MELLPFSVLDAEFVLTLPYKICDWNNFQNLYGKTFDQFTFDHKNRISIRKARTAGRYFRLCPCTKIIGKVVERGL